MKIDQQSIQETLRLITLGQLDPRQAAGDLLAAQLPGPPRETFRPPAAEPQSPTAELQSLEALVRRLGHPPAEIEHDWRRQIEAIDHRWRQTHGRPLSALQLTDLLIDAENRISLRPLSPDAAPPLSTGHAHWDPPARAACDVVPPQAGTAVGTAAHRARAASQGLRRRQAVAATLLATSAAAAVYWIDELRPRAASEPHLNAADRQGSSPARAQTPRRASAPRGAAARSMAAGDGASEAFVASPPPDRPAAASEPPRGALGWDNPLLAGGLPEASAGGTADAPAGAAAADAGGQPPLSLLAAEPDDPLLWGDREPADASAEAEDAAEGSAEDAAASAPERPTRSATPSEAVALPPLPAVGESSESQLIFGSSVAGVRWDFPVPTSIELHAPAAGRWTLVDTLDATQLAELRTSDQGLRFQWSAAAAAKPSARQVAAGRLQLTGGGTSAATDNLWLRPRLRSAPLRVDFSAPQSTASWPLDGPPLFSAAELAIDAEVPETIQLHWITPPDPQNLRRNLSLLQWTPSGASVPAIQCRIELRVTTRLSLKLRYAVQLDATMPWQPFSAPQLSAALDQITHALNRSLLDQSELARQYSAASTTGRRRIKPSKDAMERNVLRLQTLMQRLQQLDALQAAVVAGTDLRIGLTAHWPDRTQVILEMAGDP